MVMDETSVEKKSRCQFHILLKIYFGLGWHLVSSKSSSDKITIKIDVKNHKKINNQKRIFKKNKWAVKWTKGKQTQIMRRKKDNLQIFTF